MVAVHFHQESQYQGRYVLVNCEFTYNVSNIDGIQLLLKCKWSQLHIAYHQHCLPGNNNIMFGISNWQWPSSLKVYHMPWETMWHLQNNVHHNKTSNNLPWFTKSGTKNQCWWLEVISVFDQFAILPQVFSLLQGFALGLAFLCSSFLLD